MAQKTHLPSELSALVGVIDPDATSAGDHTTGWISMSNFQMIMAVIMAGTLGTGATLDAKLEQATDDTGAGAKDVDGSAITQLVKATDDDKQAVIECYAEDLDLEGEYTHVRLSITVANATSDVGAVVIGMSPRYAPASDGDLASVAEIVSL